MDTWYRRKSRRRPSLRQHPDDGSTQTGNPLAVSGLLNATTYRGRRDLLDRSY
jgi:hypothetical protein